MLLVDEPAKAVGRYREIGGFLDFAFFADTDGDFEDLLSAIAQAIVRGRNGIISPPPCYSVDEVRLLALTSRELGRDEFLGSKVNNRTDGARCGDQTIVVGGTVRSTDGRFWEAFAHQPYPLRGDPKRVQKTFDAVCSLLLPHGKQCRILDWSGPQLGALSNYFLGEHAYWSEHLFTVHVREDRWLAVISSSASD